MLSLKEKAVVKHFKEMHCRDEPGRLIVPFPVKSDATPLGDLRSLEEKRFESLKCSLRAQVYINMDHAEPVPVEELSKPNNKIYYFLMHVVMKESRTTSNRGGCRRKLE